MNVQVFRVKGTSIAEVFSEDIILADTQSALNVIGSLRYETGVNRVVINKEAVSDSFFILSTGLAGEVLQKFINYGIKIAFYGDYSKYKSKPLMDFIYESNCGKDIFFMNTREEAINRLSANLSCKT